MCEKEERKIERKRRKKKRRAYAGGAVKYVGRTTARSLNNCDTSWNMKIRRQKKQKRGECGKYRNTYKKRKESQGREIKKWAIVSVRGTKTGAWK
jgi:hypothetical protein